MPDQHILPRWRGFNLLDLYTVKHDGTFPEQDVRWIAEFGFDFVRLPMTYRLWTDPDDRFVFREDVLQKLDRGIDQAIDHGLHVCLNIHHAPGYCINKKADETTNLWKDPEPLEAFVHYWTHFARRYRGIAGEQLSFDLVNEPPGPDPQVMTRDDHQRVIRRTVAAIRRVDPDRPIVIDGLGGGNIPCPELADLDIGQSCRAYAPAGISHYKAPWFTGADEFDEPTWPGALGNLKDTPWDRARLEEHYRPWIELARSGVGVHCGEGGCFRYTPHDVFLRWFEEVLQILTDANIGYALWNFRGTFGILDSQRTDVDYRDFNGHALDGKLLELLQAY